jgi:hypothetical protein
MLSTSSTTSRTSSVPSWPGSASGRSTK